MKEFNEDVYYVDKDFDNYGAQPFFIDHSDYNDDDDSVISWDIFADMNRGESKFYPKSWR